MKHTKHKKPSDNLDGTDQKPRSRLTSSNRAMVENPPYFARFHSFAGGNSDWNAVFGRPISVRAAGWRQTPALLRWVEAARQRGHWAVLALTYEAAPAFDPALAGEEHTEMHMPVAWAAVFDPSQVNARMPKPRPGSYQVNPWQADIQRPAYDHAINRIQQYIAAGDTYQVNFTFPMSSQFSGDADAYFGVLGNNQQAEFCALLNLPDQLILSISPELFFRRDQNLLTTRPMKGTLGRGRFPIEDQERRRALAECPKNRAENLMITDLVRNDLGRLSQPGTVEVSSLFSIEKFKTVWQMTSTVQAQIPRKTTLAEMLAALFPCGSITGAPKIRAMQIIRELESAPRGMYTGAIGYVRPGGDCIFNVAIRTVTIDKANGNAVFGVGGGITADSTTDGEYDECLLKAAFLDETPTPFALLETMLLEDGRWFLPEHHLRRLHESAAYFQFECHLEGLRRKLQNLAAQHPAGRWKLRLEMERDGSTTHEITPLPDAAAEPAPPLRCGLARNPVNSADPFLFHKTTRRQVYDQARQSRPECDEVILWNERGELTEGCIHNLVAEIDGDKITPPMACGLLAGTYREELLAQGEIKEKVILPADLRRAGAVWLINSVRKWQKAILA